MHVFVFICHVSVISTIPPPRLNPPFYFLLMLGDVFAIVVSGVVSFSGHVCKFLSVGMEWETVLVSVLWVKTGVLELGACKCARVRSGEV